MDFATGATLIGHAQLIFFGSSLCTGIRDQLKTDLRSVSLLTRTPGAIMAGSISENRRNTGLGAFVLAAVQLLDTIGGRVEKDLMA